MIYQNLPKGVAFNIVLCSSISQSGSINLTPRSQADCDASNKKISKDGGAFEAPTNSPVFIDKGVFSIQLTADEMNADKIDVVYSYQGPNDRFAVACTILTGTPGAISNSPAVMTAIADAVNKGYVVTLKAINESGYNYYGLINGGTSPWWMIIQEKTDFTDVGYKMGKTNRQTLDDAWTKRASLKYSDKYPL